MLIPMRILHENYWRYVKKDFLGRQAGIRMMDLGDIKKVQWQRTRRLLEFAYENNGFYRKRFEANNLKPSDIVRPEDMLRLPITEKSDYKKCFDTMISKNVDRPAAMLSSTSGSTGEPFFFYKDGKDEAARMFAAFLLNQEGMGIEPYRKRNVMEIKAKPRNDVFSGPDGVMKKRIKNKVREVVQGGFYGMSAHDVKKETTQKIYDVMRQKKIAAIIGYSTTILLLSKLFSEKGLRYRLDHIITIGEELTEGQRQYIENCFDCKAFKDYISSECIHMGSECRRRKGYHMDIYNYYFEFLKDGVQAKEGEVGEIIVTNLNNYVFPFIRYKIGDAALLTGEKCGCGNNFPLVKEIYGRNTDTIKTPNGKEISSAFISVFFRDMGRIVKQYQVIQAKSDLLIVNIVPFGLPGRNEIGKIKTEIENFTDRCMTVKIGLVDSIMCGRSGKRKVLICQKEYEGLMKCKN